MPAHACTHAFVGRGRSSGTATPAAPAPGRLTLPLTLEYASNLLTLCVPAVLDAPLACGASPLHPVLRGALACSALCMPGGRASAAARLPAFAPLHAHATHPCDVKNACACTRRGVDVAGSPAHAAEPGARRAGCQGRAEAASLFAPTWLGTHVIFMIRAVEWRAFHGPQMRATPATAAPHAPRRRPVYPPVAWGVAGVQSPGIPSTPRCSA